MGGRFFQEVLSECPKEPKKRGVTRQLAQPVCSFAFSLFGLASWPPHLEPIETRQRRVGVEESLLPTDAGNIRQTRHR